MRPILFYTIGYPGAGKTTFARNLSHWLGATHIRGDLIGFELFTVPTYSPAEREMVRQEMAQRSSKCLQLGKHVLYDAANNSYEQREYLTALAEQHNVQAVGLWLKVPTDLAKKRASKVRDRGLMGNVARVIPSHIFDQYAAAFQEPRANEFIITISGNANFSLQYRRLQRQLRSQHLKLPTAV